MQHVDGNVTWIKTTTEDNDVYCLEMNQQRKVSDDYEKEDETNSINEVKTPAKKNKRFKSKTPKAKKPKNK